MAIYDLGTASLAANGEVTGVGTTWKAPLTLIRVGATIIFKTSPLKIYTISEIISDTRINVYNPNSETVPSGTGYAILAHDGITVQGLAQDVAETLRYYQSKETSIEGLLQFIGQDTFDWHRFEQLAKQSTTGAAEALASQIAAEESAATAISARDTTTAARDETIKAINNAGDAGTLVTLAGYGLATDTTPLISNFDWQEFVFKSGGLYRVNVSSMINAPNDIISTFGTSIAALCIQVISKSSNTTTHSLRVVGQSSTSNQYSREIYIQFVGAPGSRVYAPGREMVMVEAGKSGGGATASRARNLLDVYSKNETFQKSLNFSDVADKSLARANIGAASLGFNIFTSNQVIRQDHPKLTLESPYVADSVVGKGIFIQNNEGKSVGMIFSNNESNPEHRSATLVKPSNTREVFIPFNGGLADNGQSVPNSYVGNFNTLEQGWSIPDSSADNAPTSGSIYGSCFTQCTHGTQHGPSSGRDGLWYQQRFYNTENEIYIRTQTNTNPWSPWLKVTTSSVSDERLKDIYGDLDLSESLDNICKMEFKNFKFKDDEKQRQRRGVISQQIMNIDREYVWEVGGYYHLDQTPMLLDGLAAIKALKIKSDESDKEMVALKAEIAELKEMVKQLMQ